MWPKIGRTSTSSAVAIPRGGRPSASVQVHDRLRGMAALVPPDGYFGPAWRVQVHDRRWDAVCSGLNIVDSPFGSRSSSAVLSLV